jgi:hypothetical protein
MITGRPTKYTDDMPARLNAYTNSVDMPFVEEFALQQDLNTDTILEWTKEYPEFSVARKRMQDKQRYQLQRQGLENKVNPTMAIFQLKCNHGFIETEKRVMEHSGSLLSKVEVEFVDGNKDTSNECPKKDD